MHLFARLQLIPFSKACFRRCSTNTEAAEIKLVETATLLWLNNFVIKHKLCPWAKSVVETKGVKVKCVPRMASNEVEDAYVSRVVEIVCNEAIELMSDDEVFNAQSQARSIELSDVDDVNIGGTNILEPKVMSNKNSSNSHNHTPLTPYNTTLVVTPQFKDFDTFLNIVDMVEDTLNSIELTDYIQVASFHPKYLFNDTREEDSENFTNKSPFPIIHLLKVQDVTHAIQSYSSISAVSDNNSNISKRNNKYNTSESTTVSMDNIWKLNIKRMKRLGTEELRKQQLSIIREAIRYCQLNK